MSKIPKLFSKTVLNHALSKKLSWFVKNMPLEEIILSEFKKKKEWI